MHLPLIFPALKYGSGKDPRTKKRAGIFLFLRKNKLRLFEKRNRMFRKNEVKTTSKSRSKRQKNTEKMQFVNRYCHFDMGIFQGFVALCKLWFLKRHCLPFTFAKDVKNIDFFDKKY